MIVIRPFLGVLIGIVIALVIAAIVVIIIIRCKRLGRPKCESIFRPLEYSRTVDRTPLQIYLFRFVYNKTSCLFISAPGILTLKIRSSTNGKETT